MATINGSVSRNSDSYTFYIEWSESRASDYISTNKTTVTATAYVSCSAHTAWASGLSQSLTIDGTTFTDTKTVNLSSGVTVALISGSKTITHNTDGSKSITISANCDLPYGSGWGPDGGTASGTATLTTIPRYATSGQSLNSKTVNSIKMNWSSDSTIDYIWYSTNNGSSWTAVGSVNAKSGNYTISNLSVNTTYSIKTRVRRKDSQLTTDSTALSIATYDIAKLTETPSVNIGSSHTIKWTNPSGAATTLVLQKSDGTQVISYGTVTGTSKTVTDTANMIYALIPNANTITLYYKITTTVNGTNYTDLKACTFTVVNSNPIFSNYVYEDVNSDSTQLTGDNQTLINAFNALQITISTSNKATAQNSATMSKYRLVCGNKSVEANYSSNSNVTLNLSNVENMTFVVYAIDSRGNSTAITKSATTWKDYFAPIITLGRADRTQQVNEETNLSLSGTVWNNSFGSESNGIIECTYQYKETTSSTYVSGETTIIPTVSGNTFSASLSIKGDLGADGFDISNKYNIKITLKDKIATITYDVLLNSGVPAIAIHKNGVAFGAPYDTGVGGEAQISGLKIYGMEEGTWTPQMSTVEGANPTVTYTYQRGTYKKIGKLVYIRFYIRAKITALNGTNNYAIIKGLPYASVWGAIGEHPISLGVLYGAVSNTTNVKISVINSEIRILRDYGATSDPWKVTTTSYCEIGGSGWYETV